MVNDARPTCKMKVAAPFTNTRATPRLTFCASFTALPYNPGAQPMAGPVPAPLPLDDTQPHFPIPRPFDVSTAVRQGRPAQCQRFCSTPALPLAKASILVCQYLIFCLPMALFPPPPTFMARFTLVATKSWLVLAFWQSSHFITAGHRIAASHFS